MDLKGCKIDFFMAQIHMLWLGHNYYCVYIVFRCHMTHLWCDNINKMQNKLVFLAVLTSFGLVLDWFFEKPVTTTLGRSLSGPGTIPRLPKAVQSGFLPKKAKKPDWTGLLNSNWGRNYQCRNYCILHILEVCAISVYATGVYPSIIYHHCRYCLYLL